MRAFQKTTGAADLIHRAPPNQLFARQHKIPAGTRVSTDERTMVQTLVIQVVLGY